MGELLQQEQQLSAQVSQSQATLTTVVTLLNDGVQILQAILNGMATAANQAQAISILTKILADVTLLTNPELPSAIGLDVAHIVTTPQPKPVKPGPT